MNDYTLNFLIKASALEKEGSKYGKYVVYVFKDSLCQTDEFLVYYTSNLYTYKDGEILPTRESLPFRERNIDDLFKNDLIPDKEYVFVDTDGTGLTKPKLQSLIEHYTIEAIRERNLKIILDG